MRRKNFLFELTCELRKITKEHKPGSGAWYRTRCGAEFNVITRKNDHEIEHNEERTKNNTANDYLKSGDGKLDAYIVGTVEVP